jgi:hypothetical protein
VKLNGIYGNWKVPWGQVHRIQRPPNIAELTELPGALDDEKPSLSCLGAHGPLGIIFTQYYTPVIQIPFVKSLKNRYGVVGLTYMGVFEFGDRIRGATVTQFGASGDPKSPHFLDQAPLVSERRLKPELFYWEDVLAGTKRSYHPGEKPAEAGAAGR